MTAVAAFGGVLAVWAYEDSAQLSVGKVSISVEPFHHGALDAYVPLVDWGARFPGVHLPARLKIELQTVDRAQARRIADAGLIATDQLRGEIRDALAAYLLQLALLTIAGTVGLGGLTALALRGPSARLRWTLGATAACAVAWALAIALLLAPRGSLERPTYYAHGTDIPIAVATAEAAARASGELGAELDGQLLGLARLVVDPGRRTPLTHLPRLTIASDLHNNAVAIPAIRRAAAGGALLLAGDLTDRGTALEARAVASAARAGRPTVIVPGNHDSDLSIREYAREGAIVLTQDGRIRPDGSHGALIARVGGLRIAGYASPNHRRRAEGYRDRGARITRAQQSAFTAWLAGLAGQVDVVMVHEPDLARPAVEALRDEPHARPLLVVEGHTHKQAVSSHGGITEVNGGTAGAGGTGNLLRDQSLGLAVVTYRPPSATAGFAPLAADLVRIAPGTGEATAQRIRLDQGPVDVGEGLAPAP